MAKRKIARRRARVLKKGTVLDGRWRLEKKLGEGGMGSVWRARQQRTGMPVAIKVMRMEYARDPFSRLMFEREAAYDSQVDTEVRRTDASPGAVQVFDEGETKSGEPYIVMELLDGQDLASLMAEDALSGLDILMIARDLLEVVEGAHRLGITHRDIKPENIFLLKDGTVRLLDFGLASREGEIDYPEGSLRVGTPTYMSPEQIAGGPTSGKIDVYGTGSTIYRLLSDRVTNHPDLVQLGIVECPVPPLEDVAPGVPLEVARPIDRMLACRPEDRPTATAAREDIERAIQAQMAVAFRPVV